MAHLTFNGARILSPSGKILNYGGLTEFNDWFLPSTLELREMYDELKLESVGGFSDDYYWVSNDSNSTNGSFIYFLNGSGGNSTKNAVEFSVRAARKFTGEIGDYSLRDTGPAGGLIFHIESSTTYYESAPSDQSINHIWSNITTAVPVANNGIGFGQPNTTAIITQVGHTSSAAKLCDDLVITV